MDNEKYIQVGFTAMRGTDGKFLPAVPLYVKADEAADKADEELVSGIGHLLALRMKEYLDGCREAEVAGC